MLQTHKVFTKNLFSMMVSLVKVNEYVGKFTKEKLNRSSFFLKSDSLLLLLLLLLLSLPLLLLT